MMVNGAAVFGAAVGQQLGKLLFGDPQEEAAKQQAAAQAAAEEQARNALEQQRTDAVRDRLLGQMQGVVTPETSATLPLMSMSDDANAGMSPRAQVPPNPATGTPPPVGWEQGLNCAMGDVYARVESLGQEGKKFATELRQEIAKFGEQAVIQPRTGSVNDADVTSLDLDRQISVGRPGHTQDSQLIVKTLVVSHGDGTVTIDVQSYLSGPDNAKRDERQNIMILGADGKIATEKDVHGKLVQMADISGAVGRCLSHQRER